MFVAIGYRFASVYRSAAGRSPSTDPKFPCPWTTGIFITHDWARRTSAS